MMETRKTILAVDDNELNLEIMEEILAEDYRLLTASSGEEALTVVETESPDLVLLDIMMPGIDGYETCRRIKASESRHPPMVILVSAKAMTSERLQGYEVGADDYLTKPFDPDELLAKVSVFVRLKTAEEFDSMKTELLSLLTHEIRTPLTGVLPAAEVLTSSATLSEDERKMWGQMALTNGQRLLRLAERGLLFCQYRAGDVPLNKTRVDPAGVLQEVVGECEPIAGSRDVTLQLHGTCDHELTGDRDLLQTAACCLIDGSIHLMSKPGAIQISQGLHRQRLVAERGGAGAAPGRCPATAVRAPWKTRARGSHRRRGSRVRARQDDRPRPWR